ncbi:efflux RND transporter periplasmic adaptor subunit [Nannocystis exedens]|uniref:efflux RND transporter periplasmic adaptor subunit n=1 Tax=Nannocystis exedens TaxID=54 RepID=UPI000BBA049A|nr:efflux RND transporter periplasmic adaptor subunit [Nannocystis exedens]
MFVRADIAGPAAAGVTLPKQAVLIKDGETATAYVEVDLGVFEARQVVVGHTAGEHAQIVVGVAPGDRVAVSGALLIDQQSATELGDMFKQACPKGHTHPNMSLSSTCANGHARRRTPFGPRHAPS